MTTFSALEAKNRLGQILDAAQREPVTITRHGRPAVIVLAVQDYEALLEGQPEKVAAAKKKPKPQL
ncbi:MAG: type II toxin-antitoxin system Phd/YefM family antitoxin [Pseudomonadota bacterium]